MSDTTFDLAELEQRVAGRFCEKISATWPLPDDAFTTVRLGPDWSALLKPVAQQGQVVEISTVGQPLPPQLLQFPREQWIVYPNRRTVILLIVDRMLDLWDNLTAEQKSQAGFLLAYGGQERIA